MLVFNGNCLVLSRLALDVVTLVALGYAICAEPRPCYTLSLLDEPQTVTTTALVLSICCLATLKTAGLTRRWTISLPLVPTALLQIIRLHIFKSKEFMGNNINDDTRSWTSLALTLIWVFSMTLTILSGALCALFPALKISHPVGKYNVGVVDLHLPVKFDEETTRLYHLDVGRTKESDHDNSVNGFVSVRLFYPTLESIGSIPYLNEDTAKTICATMAKIFSPPPLNKLTWILDTWQLATIRAKRNAMPLLNLSGKGTNTLKDIENKMPVVVFSHGLLGNRTSCTYQCMNLASNGSLVVSIDHSDGSATTMKKHNGSIVSFDFTFIERLQEFGSQIDAKRDVCSSELIAANAKHIRALRKKVSHRASELVACTLSLIDLNKFNVPDLDNLGISFVNGLNINNIVVAGQSLGGASAVTAATHRPDLFSSVVAHDPALDLMPDGARRIVFEERRFEGSRLKYCGGMGGYEESDKYPSKEKKRHIIMHNTASSFHELDILLLYSYQLEKEWGDHVFEIFRRDHIFDMFRRGQLGPRTNSISNCSFVFGSCHNEFADTCMMIPTWLARAIGLTGKRSPHETAQEMAGHTIYFLEEVAKKRQE